MAKLPNVTDAEIKACHVAQRDALAEMQDFVNRIDKGYVDRIENPAEEAWHFSIIAREAANMAMRLLMVDKMQKQKDEIAKLRGQ